MSKSHTYACTHNLVEPSLFDKTSHQGKGNVTAAAVSDELSSSVQARTVDAW